MNAIDAPFRKQEYIDWLTSKEPDAIVGKLQSFVACPLAIFITETRDVRQGDLVAVAGNHIRIKARDFRFPDIRRQTPPWMVEVIHRLDRTALWSDRAEVTARKALTLMQKQENSR